jgi:2'-5' RNA ligase
VRLFAAIELDDHARAAVAAVGQRAVAVLGARSLRVVPAAQLHLTLVFLGEVAPERVPPLIAALEDDVPVEPYTMTFDGLGIFPAKGAPRVLWLGVTAGAPQTTMLHAAIANRLAELGFPRESRSFAPHLTLARWRSGGSPADRKALAQVRSGAASVRVESVTLFQSRLSSTGATYTALARARLACR